MAMWTPLKLGDKMTTKTITWIKSNPTVKFYKPSNYYSYVKKNYTDTGKISIIEKEEDNSYTLVITSLGNFNYDEFRNDTVIQRLVTERNDYNSRYGITETVE